MANEVSSIQTSMHH